MVDWARARREAIRKQAELRRRLTAAEQARDDAQAQVEQAEAAFEAANDRFADAESGHALRERDGFLGTDHAGSVAGEKGKRNSTLPGARLTGSLRASVC